MKVKLIIPSMIRYNIEKKDISMEFINGFNTFSHGMVLSKDTSFVEIDKETYGISFFDNGIIVLSYELLLQDNIGFDEILIAKENKTRELLNPEGEVVNFLKAFESYICFNNKRAEETAFFNGKYVSYALATYYLQCKQENLAYSLALKRKVTIDEISSISMPSLKTIIINGEYKILLIWGARIVLSSNISDETIYNDYIKYEIEAQYLWFLITALDKRIDSYMIEYSDKEADISFLLDCSYSVLFRKSKFDGVKNSKSHRYELDILNSIIEVSKIDVLYDNLEKKIALLKEKSSLITQKQNKKNQKFVNIILAIISFLSSISTIYSFISVFLVEDNKKLTYSIIIVCAAAVFGFAYLFKYFNNKKHRKK